MKHDNSSMYSDARCDKCDGPTLVLGGGSIWCPAEDPHPGGHFVTRVAFERTPAKQAEWDARQPDWRSAKPRRPQPVAAIPRRASEPTSKPIASPFGGGMDDFVRSDER